MRYEPQTFSAPDGTKMVILKAAEFDRLRALAEDAEDIGDALDALRQVRREGAMPGEVLGFMLDEGLTPFAAWRRYRGLTQAALARRCGLSQVWIGRIERGGGYGTRATRQKLATALDAPEWTLDEAQLS